MIYSVKYLLKGSLFWKTLPRVKGDFILESVGYRGFVLEDETRIEIPMQGTIFVMDSAREALFKAEEAKKAKK